ncbi:MAG TPA: amidase [Megasphaera sp.]|nr:amidase [Megasphaera sp.]
MQNDFIDGSLGTKEAEAIVENVKNRIREYAPENIIATMDTHEINYLSTQEGKYLPVEHCIRNTEGWQIRKDIAALLEHAAVYEKPTFGSRALAEHLLHLSKEEEISLELVGLCTDICVISNAMLLKAYFPEKEIAVRSDCCAGVTPESHAEALRAMKRCHIDII